MYLINKTGSINNYLLSMGYFVWKIDKVLWFYLITYKK
jgi:hypothetical protein